MPDDAEALGFTNRWYRQALHSALPHRLRNEVTIRVVTPPYFIATKLEAYKGRGNGDPLLSHDIEDILTLFDGRPELVSEITRSDSLLIEYISHELTTLLHVAGFDYAVQSAALNDDDRETLLTNRILQIVNLDQST